jgi:hypothetical protein
MVRPLNNQENLRINEYAGRVQKTKSVERDSSREFSYEFKDAVHGVHDQREQHEQQMPEDSYESSEEKKEKEEQQKAAEKLIQEKVIASQSEDSPGPLDIVV